MFNGGSGFPVTVAGKQVASRFIFATLAGTIEGWPTPPPAAASTTTAIDGSASHSVFTGLAISADNSTLYAADFANGKVDMWDSSWQPITTPGAFVDPYMVPGSHYAPFGIQTLNGSVFVDLRRAARDARAGGTRPRSRSRRPVLADRGVPAPGGGAAAT